MNDDDDTPAAESGAGYGRPPRHTQFKKGQSGNPKGRPKGSRNTRKAFEAMLKEEVVVTTGGRRHRMTRFEVMYRRMMQKAVQGDLAAKRNWDWLKSHCDTDDVDEPEEQQSGVLRLSHEEMEARRREQKREDDAND